MEVMEKRKRKLRIPTDPWFLVVSTSLGSFVGFWLTAGLVPALYLVAVVVSVSTVLIILGEKLWGI